MEWELLLSELIVERNESGATTFEAYLASGGDFPLRNASIWLQLFDEDGNLVEMIELDPSEPVLHPGDQVRLTGQFIPEDHKPRIIEESLRLVGRDDISFTSNSYRTLKESPGLLLQIAELLPFFEHELKWTNPQSEWTDYDLGFKFEEIIRD